MKRALGLIVLSVSGCVFGPPSTTMPLRVISDKPTEESNRLVVFLRGRSNPPEEFREAGLFTLARQRFPTATFVAPDLHLGYYYERSAATRLQEDVIGPARDAGAEHVTLVGISLGGLGALIYELEHPGEVDEIILLSPYLGEDEVWQEIVDQGGIAAWQPGPIAETDYSRHLWSELRARWSDGRRTVRVQLACGESDRFIRPNRLFAEAFLDPDNVVWLPGNHDWPTWSRGFARLPN